MKIHQIAQWKGVWVFAEQEEGCLSETSLELLNAAQMLAKRRGGAELSAVLLGNEVRNLASSLFAHGADRVYLAENPLLERYRSLPYTRVVADLVNQKRPEIFLFPSTSLGSDLAARLAIRNHTGLSAHCVRLDINDRGELIQVVPAFGGKVMATVHCPHHRPQMATVRPGVFQKGEARDKEGILEKVEINIRAEDLRQTVMEVHRERAPVRAVEEAEVVVAGGAGIGRAEDWKWVESLAKALHGEVGGTRPPFDEGWILEAQMIGQSGKTIRPNLYIGIGISGAVQHLVGIQDAQTVIAINHDPKATIFQAADLGAVADFRKLVPLLVEGIKKRDDECPFPTAYKKNKRLAFNTRRRNT